VSRRLSAWITRWSTAESVATFTDSRSPYLQRRLDRLIHRVKTAAAPTVASNVWRRISVASGNPSTPHSESSLACPIAVVGARQEAEAGGLDLAAVNKTFAFDRFFRRCPRGDKWGRHVCPASRRCGRLTPVLTPPIPRYFPLLHSKTPNGATRSGGLRLWACSERTRQ
jgi:hypothetical protein